MVLQPLNLPKTSLKLSRKEGQLFVWCIIRRKTLMLTPEEWVRQHVIHYLVNDRKFPAGLISSEQGINIHKLSRRCDVVVYGRDRKPKLLVECKAPEITLSEHTLHQIAHYNAELGVDYLWVTNGLRHALYYINRTTSQIDILEELPEFDLL